MAAMGSGGEMGNRWLSYSLITKPEVHLSNLAERATDRRPSDAPIRGERLVCFFVVDDSNLHI